MFHWLKYFRGMRYQSGQLHIATTGAVIDLDRRFRQDFWAGLRIFLYFKGRDIAHIFTRPKSQGRLAFYPQTPGPWYNIWQVIRLAGLKPEPDVAKADYIFIFEDKTVSEYDKSVLMALHKPMLNVHCDDISKDYVAGVFEDVFGYSLRIDPLTHEGPAIQKSNANGTHDGLVIQCPISQITPGQTYQRLVDSTFDGETSEDLRLAVTPGDIALVYHKHKPLDDRFGTHYLSVDVRAASDVFSPEEINLIIEFCSKMGLDFGAVDVMRDKHDGRIYIVDVNKTCMPVLCLTLKEQIAAQQKIADALMRGLMRGI